MHYIRVIDRDQPCLASKAFYVMVRIGIVASAGANVRPVSASLFPEFAYDNRCCTRIGNSAHKSETPGLFFIAAVSALAMIVCAEAQGPLSLFQSAEQAKQHCPK
jgi:hypothetical protein